MEHRQFLEDVIALAARRRAQVVRAHALELRHNGEALGRVHATGVEVHEGCDTVPRFWLGLRALRRQKQSIREVRPGSSTLNVANRTR